MPRHSRDLADYNEPLYFTPIPFAAGFYAMFDRSLLAAYECPDWLWVAGPHGSGKRFPIPAIPGGHFMAALAHETRLTPTEFPLLKELSCLQIR